jgi:hypothetical protein
MDEKAAVDNLVDAATRCGSVAEDGLKGVLASIYSGMRNGRQRPRAVPDRPEPPPPPPPGIDPTTGEIHDDDNGSEPPHRRVLLTAADAIKPRPVFWQWEGRLAIGTLGLLAGREGLGKSTLAYWIVAQITRGTLPGEYLGTPRGVLVCATEDSWEHTIVPRLMAADADLSRVYRVEVLNADEIHVGLSLPHDLKSIEDNAREVDASLLLLDPLMSRLGSLDTHRDAEVRQALEPLAAMADRAKMSVLGLIHHNKAASDDPMQLVMGSRAFTAVARSVHTVVPDPDDEAEQRRLFGTPKNNLGRTDLPTLSFTIGSYGIDTDEGTAWTGRVVWGDEVTDSIAESMRRSADSRDDRSAVSECVDWLDDYMTIHGGQVLVADVKKAAKAAGHSDISLRRARQKLRLPTTSSGYPRVTYWGDVPPAKDEVEQVVAGVTDARFVQSGHQSGHSPGERYQLSQLDKVGQKGSPVCPVGIVEESPREADSTGQIDWSSKRQGWSDDDRRPA